MTKKQKVKGKKSGSANPGNNSQEYRGPIVTIKEMKQMDTVTTLTATIYDISTTAGGLINGVYSNNPSGGIDWSSLSGVWEEFRVLEMWAMFVPSRAYDPSSAFLGNILGMAVDRNSNTSYSSYGQMITHPSAKFVPIKGPKPLAISVKMDNAAESQFQSIGTPTATTWIKLYADTLTASQSYGKLLVRWRVQMRGRA